MFQLPFWRDLKTFFLNQGIPPKKGKDIREIADDKSLDVWFIWTDFFEFVSDLSDNLKRDDLYIEKIRELYLKCLRKDKEKEDYITFIMVDCMEKKLPFPHNNLLPYALYALILDFVLNHKDLHSRLRHCKYCGMFWIVEEKRGRGRPQTFCSEKCEGRFNQNPRQVDQDNKKRYRSYERLKAKKDIIKYLRENDFTQLEAEKIYNELPDKCKSSLTEFKRTWGQSHGLI